MKQRENSTQNFLIYIRIKAFPKLRSCFYYLSSCHPLNMRIFDKLKIIQRQPDGLRVRINQALSADNKRISPHVKQGLKWKHLAFHKKPCNSGCRYGGRMNYGRLLTSVPRARTRRADCDLFL